jgi:hypothetical protein
MQFRNFKQELSVKQVKSLVGYVLTVEGNSTPRTLQSIAWSLVSGDNWLRPTPHSRMG